MNISTIFLLFCSYSYKYHAWNYFSPSPAKKQYTSTLKIIQFIDDLQITKGGFSARTSTSIACTVNKYLRAMFHVGGVGCNPLYQQYDMTLQKSGAYYLLYSLLWEFHDAHYSCETTPSKNGITFSLAGHLLSCTAYLARY